MAGKHSASAFVFWKIRLRRLQPGLGYANCAFFSCTLYRLLCYSYPNLKRAKVFCAVPRFSSREMPLEVFRLYSPTDLYVFRLFSWPHCLPDNCPPFPSGIFHGFLITSTTHFSFQLGIFALKFLQLLFFIYVSYTYPETVRYFILHFVFSCSIPFLPLYDSSLSLNARWPDMKFSKSNIHVLYCI